MQNWPSQENVVNDSSVISTQTSDQSLFFKRSGAMSEYLPVCSGSEAQTDAAEHRRARSASLLWFLLQWYSLTSCERLPSSLSYSHWCLSFEPANANPRTSLHLGLQRQPHRPVNLAAHPVSSTPAPHPPRPTQKMSRPPPPPPSSALDLSLRNKIQSPSLGGRGTQRLNAGEVCLCMCGRNFRIFWEEVLHAQRGVSAEGKVMMLDSQRHRKDACDDKPHRVRDHRTAAEVVGTRRPYAE